MDDQYDEDPYGGEDEAEYTPYEPVEQDGPGLFGDADESAFEQERPGLFEETEEPAPAAPPVPSEAPAQLALYRRYRPDSFADLIGQDHVTVPLRRALENNRVNHAYLFSGPRGCGKTTSARILARCLNCEQGPTPEPCGACQSCQDLARGGPGSIDVIEMDAASHGGVDDARDLRERAFFAPVHSRYKIYIVDEAHMVTAQGFNALLKLVEEPPPHAKFIFATTEPEKVIGTIRSRTHHYPFRLVPPRTLTDYLTQLCEAEGVAIDPNALPLVVRAGAGSVRDSLSVLDQLMGGAGPEGVSYDQAAALLGFTPDALLDEIMDAFAAGDAAGVFRCIDKVMEVGQDPRRFAEDLLARLRDLVIVSAVPEAATNGMLEVSDDQAQRLATQASGMGSGELARAAEVIATGLTGMRGTTAPRLHLELMCARVLLPGADMDERGIHARMDRLERRVGMMGDPTPAAEDKDWEDSASVRLVQPEPAAEKPRQKAAEAPRSEVPAQPQQRPAGAPPQGNAPQQRPAGEPPKQRPAGAPPAGQPPAAPTPETKAAPPQEHGLTTAEMRRAWPSVLEAVKNQRRYSHMLLSQNSQVIDVSEGTLVLGFTNPGARENFLSSGTQDLLVDRIIEVIGVELRIEAITSANAEAPQDSHLHQRPAGQRPRDEEPPRPQPSPEPAPRQEAAPDIAPDDSELQDPTQMAAQLLEQELGATVMETEDGNTH